MVYPSYVWVEVERGVTGAHPGSSQTAGRFVRGIDWCELAGAEFPCLELGCSVCISMVEARAYGNCIDPYECSRVRTARDVDAVRHVSGHVIALLCNRLHVSKRIRRREHSLSFYPSKEKSRAPRCVPMSVRDFALLTCLGCMSVSFRLPLLYALFFLETHI